MSANATTTETKPWLNANLAAVIIYGIVALLGLIVLVENFLYSSDAGLLLFREVDDLAFQISLQHMREELSSGRLGEFFSTVDYGYGNLFWAPIAIASVPLEALHSQFGIDWPLVVFPRQLSLLFTIGTVFVLRRISLDLGATEKRAALVILIYTLFPFTGYFSMRFGTVSELTFFAFFSIAIALRFWKGQTARWYLAVIFIAAAIAIKLTALLAAPITIVLLVSGLIRHKKNHAGKLALSATALFFASVILLTDPMLFLSPLDPKYLQSYIDTMRTFISVPQSGGPSSSSLQASVENLFGSIALSLIVVVLLFGLVMSSIRGEKEVRFFYWVVFVVSLGSACALLLTIKAPGSAAVYFTVIMPLISLGALGLLGLRKRSLKVGSVAIVFLLLAFDTSNRIESQMRGIQSVNTFNASAYFAKYYQDSLRLSQSESLSKALVGQSSELAAASISSDYTVPLRFNKLTNQDACFDYLFDNLNSKTVSCPGDPQFVILDNRRLGNQNETVFSDQLSRLSTVAQNIALIDRNERNHLRLGGSFGKSNYIAKAEIGDFTVFERVPS